MILLMTEHSQVRPLKAMRWGCVLAVVVLLSACSSSRTPGGYYRGDAPPDDHLDIAMIIDAVPAVEPLCASCNDPYVISGERYTPYDNHTMYRERGIASWYGKKFHGRPTASGERYDMYAASAAHKTLPLPSYARVTNLANGHSIIVKVNDRGPFHGDRIIDLSYAAAKKIGLVASGTGFVEVIALNPRHHQPVDETNPPESLPSPLTAALEKPVDTRLPTPVYLQVGVYSRGANAEEMLIKLLNQGVEPVSIAQNKAEVGAVYTVRVGPLSDSRHVQQAQQHIQQLGIQARAVAAD